MRYLATHENTNRGSFDFPVELYFIDSFHPRYEMAFHWHMECEIIHVTSGEFTLTLNNETFLLFSGESIFIPSGVLHGGTPNNCIYECVVFSFEKLIGLNPLRLEEYEQTLGQGDYLPPKFISDDRFERLIKVLSNKSPGYEFFVGGMLWQLIGDMIGQRQEKNDLLRNTSDRRRINKIKNVLRLIRNDYSSPLTLQMFSDEAELNPQYLCKSFKRLTGKTPIEYLNYYRIECAAELLQAGEKSVTDIAFACGFNDLSYFIKMFHRYKSVSPREYKKGIE